MDVEAKKYGLSLIPLSLFHSVSTFFLSRFSGLVQLQRGDMNSKSLSTSFDSIEIHTKLHGSPQTLVQHGPA